MKEWIEHEKRVSDLILILRHLDADFQDLHVQDPTVWVDVGKFFNFTQLQRACCATSLKSIILF